MGDEFKGVHPGMVSHVVPFSTMRQVENATAGWTPPSYAEPQAFSEHDVTLPGATAVPGTLTVPEKPVGVGVVLLSGGGPFDRDETYGPNKPLKDLAWGLSSRGVATVRFDKMTYGREISDFTPTEEYVPHAVAAIRLLRQQSTKVYVVGHSMGGKMAPRIAQVEPSVAGLVVMAGDTQPMHVAAMRVVRYLAPLQPGPETDAVVARMTRQAEAVSNHETEDLLFGYSARYWADVRDYDPVGTAVAVDKPMLILQGARDYQVTVEDDLSRWESGLARRTDVTIRVYENANHLFFPGVGQSTPAEYAEPQHVDPAVVDDIATWVTR